MEIDEKVLEAINLELKKMRKELFFSYYEFLENFYTPLDIDESLIFFLTMPSISIKGKSTICILLECCECAKQHKLDKEENK